MPRPRLELDEQTRHQRWRWQCAQAQARRRNEIWQLDFEQWQQLWGEHWNQRGRGPGAMSLARKDHHGAWTVSNVHVIAQDQRRRSYWQKPHSDTEDDK